MTTTQSTLTRRRLSSDEQRVARALRAVFASSERLYLATQLDGTRWLFDAYSIVKVHCPVWGRLAVEGVSLLVRPDMADGAYGLSVGHGMTAVPGAASGVPDVDVMLGSLCGEDVDESEWRPCTPTTWRTGDRALWEREDLGGPASVLLNAVTSPWAMELVADGSAVAHQRRAGTVVRVGRPQRGSLPYEYADHEADRRAHVRSAPTPVAYIMPMRSDEIPELPRSLRTAT